MSNYKKTIETQKAINDAVENIMKHFKEVVSYADMMETMADAQTELLQLMEINRYIGECDSLGLDSVPATSLPDFIFHASQAFKLLKPFAQLIGQIYGEED